MLRHPGNGRNRRIDPKSADRLGQPFFATGPSSAAFLSAGNAIFRRRASMSTHVIGKLVWCCILLIFIVRACSAQEKPTEKPDAAPVVPSGAELYSRHCVACHGTDLTGTGPFPAPYRTPPDLTTLTRRHRGKFPFTYVSKVLRNGVTLPAHGPAEMPVWGSDFATRDGLDSSQVTARIRNLANYIKTQQKH
jgi:mono/diheme cytochrome c family protein